jgi:hypothetical protein
MKEEWYLNKERAMISVKKVIDEYESIYQVHDIFFSTDAIPSLREQKTKLIEEYFRLQSLQFPSVKLSIERPRMQSSYNMMETL